MFISSVIRRYFCLSAFGSSGSSRFVQNKAIINRSYCGATVSQQTNQPKTDASQTINITDNCIEKLKNIASSDVCLRIIVDSGGCSGFEYKFLLVKNDQIDPKDDLVFDKCGAKIVVDAVSLEFLRGSTVDYKVELIRAAFRIVNNPKAAKGCSCGASFSLK